MKKISVIIPVYNGQKYIERCIDSVIEQRDFDFNDIELILINDGSKDDSVQILRRYQKKFPDAVRLIDRENRGVAQTRNQAIELASATYLVFIDQDDWLDDSFCRRMYDEIEASQDDIVVAGYVRPDIEGRIIRRVSQPNTAYSKRYTISAAWAKIHRTEFIKANNIRFYDNNYGEDIIFTMHENQLTDKITGIDYFGYNWFWNDESVSNTSQRGLRSNIRIANLLRDMLPYTNGEFGDYYMVQTAIHYLLFSGRGASWRAFVQLYQQLFVIIPRNFLSYRRNPDLIVGPRGAMMLTRLAISGFVLLDKLRLVPLFARVYCRGTSSSKG